MGVTDTWAAWLTTELMTNDYIKVVRGAIQEYVSDETLKTLKAGYDVLSTAVSAANMYVNPEISSFGDLMDVYSSTNDGKMFDDYKDTLFDLFLEFTDPLEKGDLADRPNEEVTKDVASKEEDFSSDRRWQDVVAKNEAKLEKFDQDLAKRETQLLQKHAGSADLSKIMDDFFKVAEQQQRELELKCSQAQYEIEAKIVDERHKERQGIDKQQLEDQIHHDEVGRGSAERGHTKDEARNEVEHHAGHDGKHSAHTKAVRDPERERDSAPTMDR